MKKWLTNICMLLVFAVGAGIFLYPTISDQWNKLHQSRAIASYDEHLKQMSEADYTEAWEAARAYNDSITQNVFVGDAFQSNDTEDDSKSVYRSVLDIGGNGIMGYVSIPKISQRIPVYHGTSEAVLQIAAGHLEGTKLPIGGEGNHSVIAAHRGLPSAKLFSDLDRMEVGDKFYIHVLDEVLAYQVDQILPMIDKEDYGSLLEAMSIEEGKDLITLFTCTPYGINSHRMLVRGTRVPYHGEEDVKETPLDSMLQIVSDYYVLLAVLLIALIVLFGMIAKMIWSRRRR